MTEDDTHNSIYTELGVPLLQYSSGSPTTVVSDARLRVNLRDVNDNIPQFEGLDLAGRYPAAVTIETEIGDEVVKVSAIDRDATHPNNQVLISNFVFTLAVSNNS